MPAARAWTMLVIVLVSALAVAGCVKKDPAPTSTTPTPTGTPPTGGTTPPTGSGGGSGNTSGSPPASPEAVKDKGAIQGPFEKTFAINVPVISPRSVTVLFNLTGAQAGAPATASVYLVFTDPTGKILKSANLGLGGVPSVSWSFTASDITSTGTYNLKATAQPPPGGAPAGLPSGGIANYDLYAKVDY